MGGLGFFSSIGAKSLLVFRSGVEKEIHSGQILLRIFEKYCKRRISDPEFLCQSVGQSAGVWCAEQSELWWIRGGRDSRQESSGELQVRSPTAVCALSLFEPASPPFLTRDSSSWEESGRESREKMGVTGDQEVAPAVGKRGQQKGLAPTGGPKKITGTRKLLEIPEEGHVLSMPNSLTDDYIKSVPRLQVEWPMEGEDEEREEGRGSRRKPRYQFETETGANLMLKEV